MLLCWGKPHLLADRTSKAVGMVGLAQGGHHLSFHKVPAAVAARAVHPLVVQGAEILSVLYEEAPLGQVTATHCGQTSSHLVIICQAAGQQCLLLHAANLLYDLSSMGFGRGGLVQRAIYCWALSSLSCLPPLLFPSPLGAVKCLMQVKSTG